MGTKVTISDFTNQENSSFIPSLNDAKDTLADEFDNVVYRDGSLAMTGDLNVDSNRIYNLPAPLSATEPVRLGDVVEFQGTPGADAAEPNFTFDIVTLAPGSDGTLEVTGTYPDLLLTFSLPRGTPGASGALSDGNYGDIAVSDTGATLTVRNATITIGKLSDFASAGVLGATVAGAPSILSFATVKSNLSLVKGDVGLGNVDNTSDANKPVSTAQATAIAAARLLPVTDDADNFTVGGSDTEEAYRYTGTGGHTCTVDNTLAVGALVTVYNDGSGNLAITGSGVTVVNVIAGNTTAFSIPSMSVVTLHKVADARVLASPSRIV